MHRVLSVYQSPRNLYYAIAEKPNKLICHGIERDKDVPLELKYRKWLDFLYMLCEKHEINEAVIVRPHPCLPSQLEFIGALKEGLYIRKIPVKEYSESEVEGIKEGWEKILNLLPEWKKHINRAHRSPSEMVLFIALFKVFSIKEVKNAV